MKIALAAMICAAAATAASADIKPFEFVPGKDSALGAPPPSAPCGFADLKLPPVFSVYAAGAYSGRPTGTQIDQSGHQATRIDVAVNSPTRPVVLMLGAYEPTIWNIGWSRGTKIVAVLASGYHRQVLAGLERGTPTLISTFDNRGSCGYFFVARGDGSEAMHPMARRLFGTTVEIVYPATDGKVIIGEPILEGTQLVTSADAPPASFHDPSAPVAGPAGLEDAVRKGLLRKATTADAEAWVEAQIENALNKGGASPDRRPPRPSVYNAYVVLKPFRFPAGLYGAHAATFLVPKGVPRPEGTAGHSVVHDFNYLRCTGTLCR